MIFRQVGVTAFFVLVIALQFAHYPFDGDFSWFIGWAMQDLTVLLLAAFILLRGRFDDPVAKSVAVLFCSVAAWNMIAAIFGINFEDHSVLAVIVASFFMAYAIKQASIMSLSSDPLSTTTYMYALAPVKNRLQFLNLLRPATIGIYGGRIIIAGSDVYTPHKGVFKKIPLSRVDISAYTLIDTHEVLNKGTTEYLDGLIGTKAYIFIRDCTKLRTKDHLEKILWTRRNVGERSIR